jgi:hypothetical protein
MHGIFIIPFELFYRKAENDAYPTRVTVANDLNSFHRIEIQMCS